MIATFYYISFRSAALVAGLRACVSPKFFRLKGQGGGNNARCAFCCQVECNKPYKTLLLISHRVCQKLTLQTLCRTAPAALVVDDLAGKRSKTCNCSTGEDLAKPNIEAPTTSENLKSKLGEAARTGQNWTSKNLIKLKVEN